MRWIADVRADRLQARLFRDLAAERAGDPWSPSTVLTPTDVLAEHLRERAVEHGNWAGLFVRSFRAEARERLRLAGVATDPLPRHARLDLLVHVGESLRGNVWCRHAREREGTWTALLTRLDELREAGASVERMAGTARGRRGKALAELYAAYVERLEALGPARVDEAGLWALVREALAYAGRPESSASRESPPWRVFGAYEFTGAVAETLRAASAAGRSLVFYVPATSDGAAFAGPRARLESTFGGPIEFEGADADLEDVPDRSPGPADLGAVLFDGLDPADVPVPAFRNANGPAAELDAAIRESESAVDAGIPPHEQLWIVRDDEIDPAALGRRWSFWVEGEGREAFRTHRTPSLLEAPRVALWRRVWETVVRDFPRADWTALLLDPRLSIWSGSASRADAAGLDRLSRERRLSGGAAAWKRAARRSAERLRELEESPPEDLDDATLERERRHRRREAAAYAFADRAIDAAVEAFALPPEGRFAEHADAFARSWHALFPPDASRGPDDPDTRLDRAMHRAFRELAVYDEWRGRPVDAHDAHRMLDRLLVDDAAPSTDGRRAGVRVLAARQARGIAARHVQWIGTRSGTYPRLPPPDPILGDGLRGRLAAAGLPLSTAAEAFEEEKTLFAALAGGSCGDVAFSWQREDGDGGVLSPSPWLARLMRAFAGRATVTVVPTHPRERLDAALRADRPLHPSEADLWLALEARTPASAARAFADRPAWAAGLERLLAVESPDVEAGRFDGRIAPAPPGPADWSASRLETLARCPLRAWGEQWLRVKRLFDEPDPIVVPPLMLGNAVHEAMHRLYAELEEARLLFLPESLDAARERVERVVAEAFVRSDLGDPTLARGFGVRLRAHCERAALTCLERDIERHGGSRVDDLRLEELRTVPVTLPSGRTIEVRGRFDREESVAKTRTITDYKTSKKLAKYVSATEIRRLERLQAPLYSAMAGDAPVRFVSVHPYPTDGEKAERTFRPDPRGPLRPALDALLDLSESGRFPWLAGDHCRFCEIRAACRRGHPPSVVRETASGVRGAVPGWDERPDVEGNP